MRRKIRTLISMLITMGLLLTQGGLVFASEIENEVENTEKETQLESVADSENESEILPEETKEDTAEESQEDMQIVQETVEVEKPDFISVTMPSINIEQKMFDFIIDAFGLIKETNAARYGGVSFEEGSLFFKNTDGEYAYSTHSDKLKVENKSSVPLKVKVTLTATGFEGVTFSDTRDFDSDKPYLYLAIEDGEGTEIPIDENGEAVFEYIVPAAFEPVYTIVYDEETEEVHLELKEIEDNTVKSYFGITGACNDNEGWATVTSNMAINVQWEVGAIDTEETEEITIEKEVPVENDDEEPEDKVDNTDDEASTPGVLIEEEGEAEESKSLEDVDESNKKQDLYVEPESNQNAPPDTIDEEQPTIVDVEE